MKTLQIEELWRRNVHWMVAHLPLARPHVWPAAADRGHLWFPALIIICYASSTVSFWHWMGGPGGRPLVHTSVKCRSQSEHILYNVCNVSHAGRAVLKRSQPPVYLFADAADQAIRRASSRNHMAALRHLMAGRSLRCIKMSQEGSE